MKRQAVTAQLRLPNGQELALGPLRSWEILRTDGDGCDAIRFSTSLDYGVQELSHVNNLRAYCGDSLVFTGYVDEIACSLGAGGGTLTAYGRGNAARLLDNQVQAETFRTLTTRELIKRYVYPLGISVNEIAAATVPRFSVSCGSSVMQAVQGFCAHASLKPPMFDTRGGLLLRKRYPNEGMVFDATGVYEAVWRDCRYGVLSRMELTHTRTGEKQVATYRAFIARGGLSEHCGMYGGKDTPADWRTAKQRIDAARREEFTLELTVKDPFPCQPGTLVTARLPRLGLDDAFYVHNVRSVGGESGCYAVVSLRKE